MKKVLIVCGPTATGKTGFALKICQRFFGEIISADSRQVYRGMDIVTGKDLPVPATPVFSDLIWQNRKLVYYKDADTRTWLYDMVDPDEPFSVSHWRQAADLVISDIHYRNRLPVVVGGTGLYIKSLTADLQNIFVPPNEKLRHQLSNWPADRLYIKLCHLNPLRAAQLNASDRANPKRLIRAMELGLRPLVPQNISVPGFDFFLIGLRADKQYLDKLVDDRITHRIQYGALREAGDLAVRYSKHLPSMTASGYRAFLRPDWHNAWTIAEHQYLRRQITWFNKQPSIHWFDISIAGWHRSAYKCIRDWYNQTNVKEN
jgi:tRNA dimethylallyltransferase